AAGLAELDFGVAPFAADELVRASILSSAAPLEFLHPLVRSAVLASLPAAQSGALHLRAAQILLQDDQPATEAASHLLEAYVVGEAWVREALTDAANSALACADPAAAIAWLGRALQEPMPTNQRALLLRELAVAEQRIGDPSATAHLQESLRLVTDPV